MQNDRRLNQRVLGIALSSRGFGYALFEGEKLVNWGFASTKESEDVNQWCVSKINRLCSLYEPDVIALENVDMKAAMRSSRVRRLAKQIEAFAAKRQTRVRSVPKLNVIASICGTETATRHDMAAKVAEMYPNELSFRLPKRRGTADCEDRRIRMFEAVALASLSVSRVRQK